MLEQTYKNLEVFIIDDCSNDQSLDVISKMAQADQRIHIVRNMQNKGVAKTRNIGFSLVTGDYIALLDGDDLWHPDKIEKQLKFMQETNCDICYTSYTFIDENGKAIRKPFIVPEHTDFEKLIGRNVISCSTVIFKSEIIKNHIMTYQYQHEDYAFWLELLKNGYTARGIIEPLGKYRILKISRSYNKLKAAKGRWIIFRKFLGFGLVKSIGAFATYAWHGLNKHYIKN